MRRPTLELMGAATLDLFICAFIALLIKNLIKPEASPVAPEPKAELLTVWIPHNVPVHFVFYYGGNLWRIEELGAPQCSKIIHLYKPDPSGNSGDEHTFVLRIPKSSGPVKFMAYSTAAQDIALRIARVKDGCGSPATPWTLKPENHYRYELRL